MGEIALTRLPLTVYAKSADCALLKARFWRVASGNAGVGATRQPEALRASLSHDFAYTVGLTIPILAPPGAYCLISIELRTLETPLGAEELRTSYL